jgi:phenylalanyl-tRNA synthetase beta chain
MNMTRVDD